MRKWCIGDRAVLTPFSNKPPPRGAIRSNLPTAGNGESKTYTRLTHLILHAVPEGPVGPPRSTPSPSYRKGRAPSRPQQATLSGAIRVPRFAGVHGPASRPCTTTRGFHGSSPGEQKESGGSSPNWPTYQILVRPRSELAELTPLRGNAEVRGAGAVETLRSPSQALRATMSSTRSGRTEGTEDRALGRVNDGSRHPPAQSSEAPSPTGSFRHGCLGWPRVRRRTPLTLQGRMFPQGALAQGRLRGAQVV